MLCMSVYVGIKHSCFFNTNSAIFSVWKVEEVDRMVSLHV